jgi:signal transduction histidine kinase
VAGQAASQDCHPEPLCGAARSSHHIDLHARPETHFMKTILLIDDSVMLRMTFGKALREAGYNVIEADSGSKGLALARQHLPDLILSDVQMPGGDGSSLLRDIRNDPELRARQVVLMTGRPELMTPRKGMEEGADDFLLKPVALELLLSCVATRFRRASINWRVEDEMLAQMRSLVPAQLPHEFFTPLAGIIGLVDILRSGNAPLTPEELKDIYDDIYHSAHRLHRTQRNYLLLLDLKNAQPEALVGSLSPHQVKESIQAGVNEALRLSRRKDDVTLTISPCSLAIKGSDLSRMVEELVDNALKFSRAGTPVMVEFTEAGQLVVADMGRGMTPEEVERIGVFQQFDREKTAHQGLGLGLVLVQKIASLYHAQLHIDSYPGQSTQARVVFQLAGSGEAPSAAKLEEAEALTSSPLLEHSVIYQS